MGNVTQLKNKDGNNLYPVTSTEVVYDSNGSKLQATISSLQTTLTDLRSDLESNYVTVEKFEEFIYVVSDILTKLGG